MMTQWREAWRRQRRLRSAENLLVWREQSAILAAAFRRALRQAGPDAPSDVVLNRIDWGLEHLRRLSTAVRRPLAQHDRPLADQLEACLTQAYQLRNHTLSYLIRWESYREAEQDAGRGEFAARRRAHDIRRERDEGLLPALQGLRQLEAALAELGPQLQNVASQWAIPSSPPSLAA
jgi:hypothetical protein